VTPYYQDAAVTLYHGDCREILLEIEAVGLIVTDPPFFLPAQATSSRQNWARGWSDVAVMATYFRETFGLLVSRLDRRGAFYTFCDSTSYAVFLQILYPLFDRTLCIVWDKGSGGLGSGWRHSHELIAHGVWASTRYDETFRRNVLSVSRVSEKLFHASEKPVELITHLIQAHPAINHPILDPFAGSGTTLEAARNLGRRAIGIEIEERYCEIAAKRLRQEVLPL